MKRALIHVDYTNDFVADNGVLTAGEAGQAIYPNIFALTKLFYEGEEDIFFMIDTHYKDDVYHPESQLFPPHNIAGSWGQELYGELEEYYQSIRDAEHVHYFEKSRYSAFAGTPLDLKLRERNIDTLVIVGVATDICVLHTAIDAYNLGYQILIPKNAVASFNPDGHTWALKHFKEALGAEII